MKKAVLIEILIWIIVLILAISAGSFGYYKLFVEPNVYTIQFKDIDGITKGSPVRLMGYNIGYVRNLKSKDKHINVQILVTKHDLKIPEGAMARVEFYGLGGSKSIELMPPDTSCEVGILSSNTIRLNDVAHEAISLVGIIEMIEKYVKNINQKSVEKALVEMKKLNDNELKILNEEMTQMGLKLPNKFKNLKIKQDEVNSKIQNINKNVEELNHFIKK